jgi:hypothetical protein
MLPYHLTANNYSVEVYRERTVLGKLNLHELPSLALFSISKKFVVVATKSRILKIAIPSGTKPTTLLHIVCEWKSSDVKQLILCKEVSIFAVCTSAMVVFNFNHPTEPIILNEGNCCRNA